MQQLAFASFFPSESRRNAVPPVYFQQGREVFTFDAPPTAQAGVLLRAHDNGGPEEEHEAATVRSAVAWSVGSIYTTAAAVLATPRMDSQ